MISISAAQARVLERTWTNPPALVELPDAPGLVLAEDVPSDLDSPPHDKSLVDGFAIRASDVAAKDAELEVIGRITAGELPQRPVRPATAVQIMTGAPIPAGADAVVMLEETTLDQPASPRRVRIRGGTVSVGQNIMRRGASLQTGQSVLPAGHVLRSADVGLLAEVGCCRVPVVRPPTLAVLATGNELVDAQRKPGPGLIRNSNGPLLCAWPAHNGPL